MSYFFRLLAEDDKEAALKSISDDFRNNRTEKNFYKINPSSFDAIPGKPFAYWISEAVRSTFNTYEVFGSGGRSAWVGLQTNDNFQWLRLWWEPNNQDETSLSHLVPFVKGGAFSPFYSDVYLGVRWGTDGQLMKTWKMEQLRRGEITANNSKCWNEQFYFRKGLTWPLRARRFAPQAMPEGCIFSIRGAVAFPEIDCEAETLAILNSASFDYLYKTALGRFGFPEFVIGILQLMPWAPVSADEKTRLGQLARNAWLFKRSLDTVSETSHAFLLPATLRPRLGHFNTAFIDTELARIQAEIDSITFKLYGFTDDDRQAALGEAVSEEIIDLESEEEVDDIESESPTVNSLFSWCVGVAFGRFDWRLATGERSPPPEPEPFDSLPLVSPGMLPDGSGKFHAHQGILVDELGHVHDLALLMEQVHARVDVPVPDDIRRWLQRDFFPFHLQRYSKSRRKAPIYWPLATSSGSYTLWLYYPSLNSQTFYTAINDFVEPKLKQVGDDVAALLNKGTARTRDDEKQFETLHAFKLELIELRDTLLNIAPHYHPNHDDGVQITAAPLWPLFRHKPWQKVLKDTWAKLEKGDYDWAHLAMNYWPARVREKCKTDKSLAIAHGLEALYIEPEAKPKKTRGKKKADE